MLNHKQRRTSGHGCHPVQAESAVLAALDAYHVALPGTGYTRTLAIKSKPQLCLLLFRAGCRCVARCTNVAACLCRCCAALFVQGDKSRRSRSRSRSRSRERKSKSSRSKRDREDKAAAAAGEDAPQHERGGRRTRQRSASPSPQANGDAPTEVEDKDRCSMVLDSSWLCVTSGRDVDSSALHLGAAQTARRVTQWWSPRQVIGWCVSRTEHERLVQLCALLAPHTICSMVVVHPGVCNNRRGWGWGPWEENLGEQHQGGGCAAVLFHMSVCEQVRSVSVALLAVLFTTMCETGTKCTSVLCLGSLDGG